MRPVVFCFALVVVAGAAAYGGSNVSAASGQTAAARDAVSGQSSNVKTVPHETLRGFLPELPGWKRGEINGETSNEMGISISRVQADYDKGEMTLSFEIMDSSLNQMLTSAFLMAAKTGVVEQTSVGYTKGTTVAGFPAVESWTPAAKNGELGLLVGGRYLVKVSGSTVPDVETIRKAVEAIDLKKLAALK
ncbi:MAG TPA: hypothetical protein VES67_00480 [Vicinamibacterales bacterium]|nr:hypothetical protein [Vicinamibacterales bacterium]